MMNLKMLTHWRVIKSELLNSSVEFKWQNVKSRNPRQPKLQSSELVELETDLW